MNKTLIERVGCLLSEEKLSKFFQGEALNMLTNVISLSPSVPLQDDVPDRVWFVVMFLTTIFIVLVARHLYMSQKMKD